MNRFNHPYCLENLPNRRLNNRIKQILERTLDPETVSNFIVEILDNEIKALREDCKFEILSPYNSKKKVERWKSKDLAFMHIEMLLKEKDYSNEQPPIKVDKCRFCDKAKLWMIKTVMQNNLFGTPPPVIEQHWICVECFKNQLMKDKSFEW